jgi:hypothetical protein
MTALRQANYGVMGQVSTHGTSPQFTKNSGQPRLLEKINKYAPIAIVSNLII